MGLSPPDCLLLGLRVEVTRVTCGDADSCVAHGIHKSALMSSFSAVELDLQLVSRETLG